MNKDSNLTEDENSASFHFVLLVISSIIDRMLSYLSFTTQFHVKRFHHFTDVSILWNIISENECHIIKSESKEAENEFFLNINEQLT